MFFTGNKKQSNSQATSTTIIAQPVGSATENESTIQVL